MVMMENAPSWLIIESIRGEMTWIPENASASEFVGSRSTSSLVSVPALPALRAWRPQSRIASSKSSLREVSRSCTASVARA